MAWVQGLVIATAGLGLINLMVFAVYAHDKRRAQSAGRRVSERRLLWLAALGGGIGAKAAQHRLRHKTRKQPFARRLNRIVAGQAVFAALLGAVLIWSEPTRRATEMAAQGLAEAVTLSTGALWQGGAVEPEPMAERAAGAAVKINRGL